MLVLIAGECDGGETSIVPRPACIRRTWNPVRCSLPSNIESVTMQSQCYALASAANRMDCCHGWASNEPEVRSMLLMPAERQWVWVYLFFVGDCANLEPILISLAKLGRHCGPQQVRSIPTIQLVRCQCQSRTTANQPKAESDVLQWILVEL